MALQGAYIHRILRQLEHGSGSESESDSDSGSNSSERSQGTNVKANIPPLRKTTKRKAKSPPSPTSVKYVETSKFRRYLENGGNPMLTSDDEIIDDSSCDALSSEDGNNVPAVNRDRRGVNYESSSCISGEEEGDELEAVLGKNNGAKQKKFCFFCEYVHLKDVIDTEPIQKLCRAYRDNYGRIENVQLAKLMHHLYKDEIYTPHQNTTTPIPMWRTKTIKAHMEDHTEEPENYVKETITKYKDINKNLNKIVFQIDETGHPTANLKLIKTQVDVDKMICQLYAQKLPTMNFGFQKNSTKVPR